MAADVLSAVIAYTLVRRMTNRLRIPEQKSA